MVSVYIFVFVAISYLLGYYSGKQSGLSEARENIESLVLKEIKKIMDSKGK